MELWGTDFILEDIGEEGKFGINNTTFLVWSPLRAKCFKVCFCLKMDKHIRNIIFRLENECGVMQEEQQVQFVPLNAIGLRNPRKKYLRRQKGSNKGRVIMWSGKNRGTKNRGRTWPPRCSMLSVVFYFLLRFLIIAAFERWEDHLRIVGTICCSIHQEFATFSLDFMVHLLLRLAWSYSRELLNLTDFASLSTNGLSTVKHA